MNKKSLSILISIISVVVISVTVLLVVLLNKPAGETLDSAILLKDGMLLNQKEGHTYYYKLSTDLGDEVYLDIISHSSQEAWQYDMQSGLFASKEDCENLQNGIAGVMNGSSVHFSKLVTSQTDYYLVLNCTKTASVEIHILKSNKLSGTPVEMTSDYFSTSLNGHQVGTYKFQSQKGGNYGIALGFSLNDENNNVIDNAEVYIFNSDFELLDTLAYNQDDNLFESRPIFVENQDYYLVIRNTSTENISSINLVYCAWII